LLLLLHVGLQQLLRWLWLLLLLWLRMGCAEVLLGCAGVVHLAAGVVLLMVRGLLLFITNGEHVLAGGARPVK
jgi:hypothetical protein